MERREAFEASGLNRLHVRLRRASVAVLCSNVEQFEVEIAGHDGDKQIDATVVKAENGLLSVIQPGTSSMMAKRFDLQVRVFIPTSWKGEISVVTLSGTLEAMGLRGTDVTLGTASGVLEAASVEAITFKAETSSGAVHVSGAVCEQLQLNSLSGDIHAEGCDFRTAGLRTASGCCRLQAVSPFDSVSASTASGDIVLDIPFSAVDASFHTASGRIRTGGVDLVQDAPEVRMNTLSGNLVVNNYSAQENEHI